MRIGILIFFLFCMMGCFGGGSSDDEESTTVVNQEPSNGESEESDNSETSVTGIEFSAGTISPNFSSGHSDYQLGVRHRNDTIQLNLQIEGEGGVTVNGSPYVAGMNISLNVGSTEVTIVAGKVTYSIEITRPRQFVYVSNVNTSSSADTLSLFSINPTTGALEPSTPSSVSVGDDPYDLLVSPQGGYLYVANAADDTLQSFSINPTSGALTSLSPSTVSTGNTPYAMVVTNAEDALYIPMGDSTGPGQIDQFQLSSGVPTAMSDPSINTGNNAWFMAITPNSQYVYATIFNGFGDPNPDSIAMFSVTSNGLQALSPATVATGDKPWHLNVHPNGNFIYNTNYGDGTVSAYSINSGTGQLSQLSGSPFSVGSNPIGLAIDPQGRFLFVANNASGNISVFQIATNGTLTSVETIASNTPYGLEVDGNGEYLYVANTNSNTVSTYSINQSNGSLSLLGTASTGVNPRFIRIAY